MSIRWAGFGDNLRLFVYRGATRVGSSTGIVAQNQSVTVPMAPNGHYRVFVAFDRDSISDAIAYEGVAEVEYPPRAVPARPLLPDLAVRALPYVTFDTPSFDFFEPAPPAGQSCYASEAAEEGARVCLRFDQVVANQGEGPVELRFRVPRDPQAQAQDRDVLQRLRWSDDPGRYEDRLAGSWEFHPVHDHYHFRALTDTRLWTADSRGRRLGPEPLRTGRKVGYCVADILLDAWAEKGNGARTFNAPDCFFPAEADQAYDYLIQGITPGFADVYEWFVPDQYIDVAGVPDGDYVLETTADPENAILESDESNNCSAAVIRVTGTGSPSPAAQILGAGQRC